MLHWLAHHPGVFLIPVWLVLGGIIVACVRGAWRDAHSHISPSPSGGLGPARSFQEGQQ